MTAPTAPRRWLLHVDMDQFLAAVEVLRRPELKGRPVGVGGDGYPTRARQVVSTASYEARAFGVHSGMPIVTAARRCPDAVFLPVDFPAYDAASAEVWTAVREMGYPLEVWGWDEGYLCADVADPEVLAAAVQDAVFQRTGLSCAVGIGDNKLQAKIATSFGKPGGIGRLTSPEWLAVMGDRPTDAVWGIGSKTARKLASLDLRTVHDLANADRAMLATTFGPTIGPWLLALGQGRGSTEISTEPWVARSKSHETTYPRDLVDPAEVAAEVRRLATQLTEEVVADGRVVHRVAVKVRTSTFWTRTKIRKLPEPSIDPAVVADAAVLVLDRFEITRPIRLLGVQVELDRPA